MNEMPEHCSQAIQIGNKGKEGLAYKHKRAGNTETRGKLQKTLKDRDNTSCQDYQNKTLPLSNGFNVLLGVRLRALGAAVAFNHC